MEERSTETVIAVGTPLVSSVVRLKGRARGAMVGAVFGSAWMSWVARRNKNSAADRERWASIAPFFWIDTAAEWALGSGAVVALAHFGRLCANPAVPRNMGFHLCLLSIFAIACWSPLGDQAPFVIQSANRLRLLVAP